MSKRLYEVVLTMYVAAEDEDEALREAGWADVMACDLEVYEATTVPTDWLEAYPFGDEGDRDCKSYLEEVNRNRTKGGEGR